MVFLHTLWPTRCRPTCRLFVGDSLCCQDYGIVLHAAVRLWLVCNADVYLPEPKCLTGGIATGAAAALRASLQPSMEPLSFRPHRT